jgi:hypothetical protein
MDVSLRLRVHWILELLPKIDFLLIKRLSRWSGCQIPCVERFVHSFSPGRSMLLMNVVSNWPHDFYEQ